VEVLAAGAFKLKVESKKGKVIQFALGRSRSSELKNREWKIVRLKPLSDEWKVKNKKREGHYSTISFQLYPFTFQLYTLVSTLTLFSKVVRLRRRVF
jgi:hypothetical protein